MKRLLIIMSMLLGTMSLVAEITDACIVGCDKQLQSCKLTTGGLSAGTECLKQWQRCKESCQQCEAPCESSYKRCRGGFSTVSQCQEKLHDCLGRCKR